MNNNVSRWKRKKNPGKIAIQPRDRAIMIALYSFRILSREQIEMLFNFKCTRRVNNRLRKLYDHRYISRFFQPTIRGSAKAIYYLGPKGVNIVSEELGHDRKDIQRKRKSTSQFKEFFLAHAMEINDIRIAFTLAILVNPEMKLERWINDNDCQQEYWISKPEKDVVKRFRPDGYFRFWHQGKLYSFFLEHDRSTMTLDRFKKKVHLYEEFADLGYYRQRFGVKYFSVLVVTRSQERLKNIKKTVEAVTDRFFWYTTLEQITPTTVFNPIWQRTARNEYFPLINR